MNCDRCGAPLPGAAREGRGVASAVCISGHRVYLLRADDGTWETQEQRMQRMRTEMSCPDCGCTHIRYDSYHPTRPVRCDECTAEQMRGYAAKRRAAAGSGRGRRGRARSPWRVFRIGGF